MLERSTLPQAGQKTHLQQMCAILDRGHTFRPLSGRAGGEGMKNRTTRTRRVAIGAALAAVVAAALIFIPAAIESTSGSSLYAYAVQTTRGPLTACSDADQCPLTSTVWHFIYVANGNRLSNLNGATTRETLTNSYVVSSVDIHVFVNGVEWTPGAATFTPPPNAY